MLITLISDVIITFDANHKNSHIAMATGAKTANQRVRLILLSSAGADASSGVALYSGLGAGLIAVVILAAAILLYRKSQSGYGADAIDSAALAGGFQSFHFKTTRQGETAHGNRHDDDRHDDDRHDRWGRG